MNESARNTPVPIVKDLVLIGGGHSHVAVLRRFGMKPMPGVRLTVICRDAHTPYSGMLPGYVAGHYSWDDIHIDLGALSRFAGARFFHAEATGIDLAGRRVICDGRPPVPYDLLSINTGSAPVTAGVPGAADNAVPVKPINNFLDRWEALRARAMVRRDPMRIAVVGAGAGGVEILLAIRHRLRTLRAGDGRTADDIEFHLFSASDEILPSHNARVRRSFTEVLDARGVTVHAGEAVAEVAPGRLRTGTGGDFTADEILWVTAAGAPDWPRKAGLDVDEGGFICVGDTLQSTSHPDVFAVGDVASMVGRPRPKAGVIAVRQGPPLARNLRRALTGRAPLPFRPQAQFLSLISTGDKYAVASRGGLSVKGSAVWRWKDWIDVRFMRKYNELPDMAADDAPVPAAGLASDAAIREISALAMRCGGCGAKIGATVLSRALETLRPVERADVLIGLDAPDDAAVVEVPPGKVAVQTVDYFRAMIDDPFVFGKIAANHSLGDIYAMGAEPQTALAIATVPFGLEAKMEDTLSQMMAGAAAILDEAGCALVGGHSSEGPELALGFAVNGLIDRDRVLRKAGLQPGDRLVLTKPIGSGTLFAADMRHRAKGRWIAAALGHMTMPNRAAAECLAAYGAHAATDVTGFGLLGHLVEMVRASDVDVALDLDTVPLMEGAAETVCAGFLSSLQPQNVRLHRAVANVEEAAGDARYPLIYDPQTAGGLLAGIPADRAEDCVAALRAAGYASAAIVGEVLPRSGGETPVTVSVPG